MSSLGARKKYYSDCLCKALEKIGVNQWMRRKYYEYSAIGCIEKELLSLSNMPLITHSFGSIIEGTAIGTVTDTDTITIAFNNVVEQGFEGTSVPDENTVVVVTDTHPGFVKLKIDKENIKFKSEVSDGHRFMLNIYRDEYTQQLQYILQCNEEFEKHGPALNIRPTGNSKGSVDSVTAFCSKSWLSFNQEFFNRPRHHGWPSQESLDIMKGQGCLFVPTGHHSCKEEQRRLQWRISFSFQERHLMLNLNTAQYKCYVLLKLVKIYHISPIMELTSYHCKTALLYTIENTDVEIWKEDNILKCFVLCLTRIKKWSRKRMCPSYFIPELNLFTGKIEEQELRKLTRIFTNIIRRPKHYLQQISTDNFGSLVELYTNGSTDDENIEEKVDTNVGKRLHTVLTHTAYEILRSHSLVLKDISNECGCLDMAIKRHYNWLNNIQSLQSQSNMKLYKLDRVLWAYPHIYRFLHSSLASHLALKDIRSLNTQTKTWHILSVAYNFWMGLQSDAYSGKMKLATFLFHTGYLSSDALKSNYSSTLVTQAVCACSVMYITMLIEVKGEEYLNFLNLFKSSPVETLKMSTSTYIEKYVSACTIFLPTESELTLYPLQFEMHRRFASEPTKYDIFIQNNNYLELYNCATLDSRVYYVLLMIYLSGTKERAKYMDMLVNYSVGNTLHRDTTWNVLGWFISNEEINQMSLMCYKASWDYTVRIENYKHHRERSRDRNAAKWHLALLLYRAWFNKKPVKVKN